MNLLSTYSSTTYWQEDFTIKPILRDFVTLFMSITVQSRQPIKHTYILYYHACETHNLKYL